MYLVVCWPNVKNFVDSCIEYTRNKNFPLMLIASRRQIDAEDFGGGYVNNWTTETFSNYVKKRSNGKIILCRDHGGPFQGNKPSNSEKAIKDDENSKNFLKQILITILKFFILIQA